MTKRIAGMAAAAVTFVLLMLIRVYQLAVSPLIGPTCRYWPSCSHYALEAVQRHGPLGGSWLALRRLARCHPWGGEGVDPVPEPPTRRMVR